VFKASSSIESWHMHAVILGIVKEHNVHSIAVSFIRIFLAWMNTTYDRQFPNVFQSLMFQALGRCLNTVSPRDRSMPIRERLGFSIQSKSGKPTGVDGTILWSVRA
jgi:hypothetical protein